MHLASPLRRSRRRSCQQRALASRKRSLNSRRLLRNVQRRRRARPLRLRRLRQSRRRPQHRSRHRRHLVRPKGRRPRCRNSSIRRGRKGNDPGAKEVCFTGKDARTEAGQPVVAAALIEPEGEPKKLFRVTLPSPLQLQYGTRIVIDKEPPISSSFFTCFANGCMADYDATPELVGKLKKGQMLQIQAINLAAAAITFPLPLADNSGNSFQKANEGPPTDPKVFEEQQKKLQQGLQQRD